MRKRTETQREHLIRPGAARTDEVEHVFDFIIIKNNPENENPAGIIPDFSSIFPSNCPYIHA